LPHQTFGKGFCVTARLPGKQKHFEYLQLGQRFGAFAQQPFTHALAMSFCVMVCHTFWYSIDPKK
jgi:hypothetical protein